MDDEQAPAGIDPTIPSVARMYDYYLGGKDNFASDREAAENFMAAVPGVREVARANRAFLRKAVAEIAGQGVRQFLDIGSGLPTQENVHQVAHRIIPDAKVVYVDNDPIVMAHGRALLADNPHTVVVQADMREPKALLDHPEIRANIDFDRPVAVIMLAMLHFVPGDDEAAAIVTAVRETLAPGSYLVLSHGHLGTTSAEEQARAKDTYRPASAGSITPRGPAHLAAYTEGLEVLDPGIVPVQAWRPEFEEDAAYDLGKPGILGVVARMP
ncbi:SAM-dependent methyltransferase [Planomonospora venezuelensis]|uniref:O-methyltransferase involved in polyketide biosynthesis n=1 Tax=Planomonospora venezuelensis TaxID=1999 RepID=A0A841DC02_PLAVE|nr:SAM-dependent methyltransferase [Planomonospora venezuelensis]MBB5965635.1 O-methyltransferase involved in polyketide biosynthesis [Planomonospora venezuelensis]